MRLTERHMIKNNHSLYSECDKLCFQSKNIYNLSVYRVRKEFIDTKSYNALNTLFHVMKNEECFQELPMKVATATTISVQKVFKSFFKGLASYNKTPAKFKARPCLPNYLHKTDGRYIVSYNYQAISKMAFKKYKQIKLSQTNISINTKIEEFASIDCVRIVPRIGFYVIEICYSIPDVTPIKDNKRYASIDIGLNNLATITSNTDELSPLVINGKPLKSINQYYNKKKAYYLSKLELVNKTKKSKRLTKLTNKRNNKVDDYLHKSSTKIVNLLVENNMSKLVIGKNDNWKQDINIGKKTNQNFVSIPHTKFITMLSYKCEKVGISVVITEESYTSKCSFLDMESISKQETYMGKRIRRGMFRSGNGTLINSDVNGSYNILRKAIPKAFANGIEGVVVHPRIIV